MKNTFTFALLLLSTVIFAQNQDCETAIEIFTKDPMIIDTLFGYGEQEILDNDCGLDETDVENNSVWFKFSAHAAGNLLFTITPLNDETDIDFYLYKAILGNCNQLQKARCVATACLGPMGLSEEETEISEDLNCESDENGFVRDVFMNKNEVYYLMVDNFTSNETGFEISFCGTVLFSEQDTVCTGDIVGTEYSRENGISLQPNPSHTSFVIEGDQAIEEIKIIDLNGRQVYKDVHSDIRIVNHRLLPGLYTVLMRSENNYYYDRIVVE